MSRATHTCRVLGLLLAALLIAAMSTVTGLPGAPGGGRAQAQTPTEHTVAVSVLSITPATPGATTTPTPLTIVVRLTNTGTDPLSALTLHIDRGDPIGSQAGPTGLDAAIANPQPPTADEDSPLKDSSGNPLTVPTSLPAGGSRTMTIKTSSSLESDVGLCICQVAAIYPLWFSVYYADPHNGSTLVGTDQSYVPAFYIAPRPVEVSWLWPLLEAPHRLGTGTVFLDDGLASSVSTGRLARVLQVADTVTRQMPITLVVDPELIDELVVMSTGYQVQQGHQLRTGTGGSAAAAWLATLRTVVHRPGVELQLTPPADPDVQALTDNGLNWSAQLPADEQQAVTAALGVASHSDLVWPLGESLDENTLGAVATHGATTVVLNQATLPNTPDSSSQPNGLSTLSTSGGLLTAAVTSDSIQRYVQPVLSVHGTGTRQLPELVAEVAIRAVEAESAAIRQSKPAQEQYVVITPPRNIDPAPATAAEAIVATAHTSWSVPLTLAAARTKVAPVARAALAPDAGSPEALPATVIADIKQLQSSAPALASMLPTSPAAELLGWVPGAIQNLQSSAWSVDQATGVARSTLALQRLQPLEQGVSIVPPSSGAYTLGSSNAPLPLTLQNTLPYQVTVDVEVSPDASGLVGFSADVVHTVVPADSKVSLRVPTHVERTGRFRVLAGLYTPTPAPRGLLLGDAVPLTVHSTALGRIGVIITVVAGLVLAVALIVRLVRRLRRRGPRPPVPPELAAIPQ